MDITQYIKYTVTDRFLRYVKIDTQSDPTSESCPSTSKQKILGQLLVDELKDMGISDAELDEFGYVYASIPANSKKQVPVICFCSHMDTSPDCSGTNVIPQLHENYSGGDIILSGDTVIRMKDHPDLSDQLGHDIITADGSTLLGADNKAGIAEIMDAANFFMSHPEFEHGEIKILFTPDEEIGRGVDKVDLQKLGADYAYTVDGESAGTIEDETFSADGVTLHVFGVSTHPGFAKGKMENALKIASEIVACLPKEILAPEMTSEKQGFIHPVSIQGTVESASVEFIIRDFDAHELIHHYRILDAIVKEVMEGYLKSRYELIQKNQYRNTKEILNQHPRLIEFGLRAIERSGLKPKLQSIRGGTDGSRLSFMGLPCPNIFAGEHAFHSKQEWVSVQDMQKAVLTIINLALIWEEETANSI